MLQGLTQDQSRAEGRWLKSQLPEHAQEVHDEGQITALLRKQSTEVCMWLYVQKNQHVGKVVSRSRWDVHRATGFFPSSPWDEEGSSTVLPWGIRHGTGGETSPDVHQQFLEEFKAVFTWTAAPNCNGWSLAKANCRFPNRTGCECVCAWTTRFPRAKWWKPAPVARLKVSHSFNCSGWSCFSQLGISDSGSFYQNVESIGCSTCSINALERNLRFKERTLGQLKRFTGKERKPVPWSVSFLRTGLPLEICLTFFSSHHLYKPVHPIWNGCLIQDA